MKNDWTKCMQYTDSQKIVTVHNPLSNMHYIFLHFKVLYDKNIEKYMRKEKEIHILKY